MRNVTVRDGLGCEPLVAYGRTALFGSVSVPSSQSEVRWLNPRSSPKNIACLNHERYNSVLVERKGTCH